MSIHGLNSGVKTALSEVYGLKSGTKSALKEIYGLNSGVKDLIFPKSDILVEDADAYYLDNSGILYLRPVGSTSFVKTSIAVGHMNNVNYMVPGKIVFTDQLAIAYSYTPQYLTTISSDGSENSVSVDSQSLSSSSNKYRLHQSYLNISGDIVTESYDDWPYFHICNNVIVEKPTGNTYIYMHKYVDGITNYFDGSINIGYWKSGTTYSSTPLTSSMCSGYTIYGGYIYTVHLSSNYKGWNNSDYTEGGWTNSNYTVTVVRYSLASETFNIVGRTAFTLCGTEDVSSYDYESGNSGQSGHYVSVDVSEPYIYNNKIYVKFQGSEYDQHSYYDSESGNTEEETSNTTTIDMFFAWSLTGNDVKLTSASTGSFPSTNSGGAYISSRNELVSSLPFLHSSSNRYTGKVYMVSTNYTG